jgi:hypothetical protein
MLGGLVVVPQQQTRNVTLETKLPVTFLRILSDNRINYTLRVQKQAGIVSPPLEIKVSSSLGYKLLSTENAWTLDAGKNLYGWSGKLMRSKDIELVFVKDN